MAGLGMGPNMSIPKVKQFTSAFLSHFPSKTDDFRSFFPKQKKNIVAQAPDMFWLCIFIFVHTETDTEIIPICHAETTSLNPFSDLSKTLHYVNSLFCKLLHDDIRELTCYTRLSSLPMSVNQTLASEQSFFGNIPILASSANSQPKCIAVGDMCNKVMKLMHFWVRTTADDLIEK